MFRPTRAAVLALTLVLVPVVSAWAAVPAPAKGSGQATAAQTTPQSGGAIPPIRQLQTIVVDQNAEKTREELMTVFQRFSPELKRVLKLDPTLMSNQAYMAPYPALVQFLQQHPEIVRNPTYFLEQVRMQTDQSYYTEPRESSSARMVRNLIDGIGILIIFGTIVWSVIWMLKTFVDSRRWNRLARVQSEAHNKILDRFGSNAELIAYVESPAGQQFLQASPISVEPVGNPRRMGAPFGRILWSVQAGVVLAAAGIGFRYMAGSVEADAVQSMQVLGTFGIALGLGFVVSAVIAWFLSKQLGLLDPMPTAGAASQPASGGGRGTPSA